jgi:hypothetical protein
MAEANLEDMNHLQFSNLRDEPAVQGWRKILVTGPGHAYVEHFWPPGHVIGYEHTFTATPGRFSKYCVAGGTIPAQLCRCTRNPAAFRGRN